MSEMEPQCSKTGVRPPGGRDILLRGSAMTWQREHDCHWVPGGRRATQNIKIPAAWWSDPLLTCFWRENELRPIKGARAGRLIFEA